MVTVKARWTGALGLTPGAVGGGGAGQLTQRSWRTGVGDMPTTPTSETGGAGAVAREWVAGTSVAAETPVTFPTSSSSLSLTLACTPCPSFPPDTLALSTESLSNPEKHEQEYEKAQRGQEKYSTCWQVQVEGAVQVPLPQDPGQVG